MIPPSALEAALALAFEEPGARPAFYTALLDSELLMLVADPPKASGGLIRPAITSWLRNDGEHVIPLFTSPRAVREALLKDAVVGVVPTRALLAAMPGHAIHINPGSPHNCQLSADDVASLLEHGTIHYGVSALDSDEPHVSILPADHRPAELEAALTVLFSTHSGVEAAYTFERQQMSSGERTLVIGVMTGDIERLIGAISSVIVDTYRGPLPVDVMAWGGATEMPASVTASRVSPFYERAWGSRLQRAAPGRQ